MYLTKYVYILQDGHGGNKVDYIKVFFDHQVVFEKQNVFC